MKKTWQEIRKLVFIRLDSLGDVVMTTPALRAVKESVPLVELTLLTSSQGAAVSPYISAVDKTIVFNAPWVQSDASSDSNAVIQMIEKLKTLSFDAAIISTVYSQNPMPAILTAYQAGIPLRLSYSHHNPYQLLTDWYPDPDPSQGIRHEVKRQLDLVKKVGYTTKKENLNLTLPFSAISKLGSKLDKWGISSDKPIIVLHPGASEVRRRYSPAILARAAREVASRVNGLVVVTGTVSELPLTAFVSRLVGPKGINLSGRTTLEDLIALISRASLLISNNSGPVHLATALKTPVVVLYANTNPQHTPWQVKNEVLRFHVPCKQCQRGICSRDHPEPPSDPTVDDIVKKALALLSGKKSRRPHEPENFTSSMYPHL